MHIRIQGIRQCTCGVCYVWVDKHMVTIVCNNTEYSLNITVHNPQKIFWMVYMDCCCFAG